MIEKVNKNAVKIAALCLTMVIMGPTAISPIIANLIQAFPESKVTTIQFLMTYPCIIIIIVTIIMGKVSAFVPKKVLACIGTFLIALMGVGAYFFHGSVEILYMWATVMGVGIGMTHMNATAIIAEYFEGPERGAVMGLQSSAGNVGGMIMTLVGGAVAMTAWHANYLVYLLALVGFFACLIGVPSKKETVDRPESTAPNQTKEKLNPLVFYYVVIVVVFLALFNVSPVNFSLIVTERGLGEASFSGMVTSVFLLGGIISGIFFGVISRKLKNLTISFGFIMLFVGYIIINVTTNAAGLLTGAFLAGASICLIVPKITFNVTALSSPATMAMAVALVTAATNVGSFFSPLFTTASQAIFNSSSAGYRFVLAGIIACVAAIIVGIIEKSRKVPV